MLASTQQPQDVSAYTDQLCVALLGLAEHFRTSNPPRIRLCIQCLQALFDLPLAAHWQTVAHFHLGKILHHYTLNQEHARQYLERAFTISLQLTGFEEIRVQVASILAEIYMEMDLVSNCREILRRELDNSRGFSFWHCRFLFQLAEVYMREHNVAAACQLLEAGATFCAQSNIAYTESLFLLSKGLLALVDRSRQSELRPILERVSGLIQRITDSAWRRESIKTFFLLLQVCYFLMTGMVKSAAPALKQLQNSVQVLTTHDTNDNQLAVLPVHQFQWLPNEVLSVLAYLVTAVHSMQTGQMDRCIRYVDRANHQIDKLRLYSTAHSALLADTQLVLVEHNIMCRLVDGHAAAALDDISRMCRLTSSSPELFGVHEAQMHTLLGLYAVDVRCNDHAEAQFKNALRVLERQDPKPKKNRRGRPPKRKSKRLARDGSAENKENDAVSNTAKDIDLWTFVNLNLALVYLHTQREQEFYALLERVSPERLQTQCQSLLAAANYVRGMQSFMQNRYQDAKRYLKDSLSVSSKEDIMRMSAAALVLLAHIYFRYKDVQECSNMLNPAMELLQKTPDIRLQSWATTLLRDVYAMCGNQAKSAESRKVIDAYQSRIQADINKAIVHPNHAILLAWSDGPCPELPQSPVKH